MNCEKLQTSDREAVISMLGGRDEWKAALALTYLIEDSVYNQEYAGFARKLTASTELVGLNIPVAAIAAAYLSLGGFEPYEGDDFSTLAIIRDYKDRSKRATA